MRLALPIFAACLALGQVATDTPSLAPLSTANEGYLLTTFQSTPRSPNTNAVFQALISHDGANFAYQQPQSIMNGNGYWIRDPSVACVDATASYTLCNSSTTSRTYLDTHTAGVLDEATDHALGFSSSSNGNAWATATIYECQTEHAATWWCFSPEWFIDPAATGLSSIHVFFARSDTLACCSNFQIREIHPTASDFVTNVASWSTSVLITVTGMANTIDPFMVCKNSVTNAPCQNPAAGNDKYYLWYKDQSTEFINYASATTLTGTQTNIQTGDWMGFGIYIEAPALLKTVAGSPGTWRLFFDEYQNSSIIGQIYYSDSTDGWATWSTKAPIGSPFDNLSSTVPTGPKHGTVIPYP